MTEEIILLALLKWAEKQFVKNLSLLAGKLFLEKKVCAIEWCMVWSQKYTKSFGGKICATDLSHQQSEYMFDFRFDSVQKRRIFFLVGHPT